MRGLLFVICIFSLFSCRSEHYVEISKDVMIDKVKGAWAGKMIGVMYGRSMEFKATGKPYTNQILWKPEMLEGALLEDDIYGQLNFMMTMEKYGIDVSLDSLAKRFAYAGFPLCHANLQARKNYLSGIPVDSLSALKYSIHAEDLDFQIESDFIGFINPAMPQASSDLCAKVGSIMASGDGLYGGMYMTTMHALAYVSNNVDSIVRAALLSIPPESTYAQCVKDVIAAYDENPDDWMHAWKKIQQKWGEHDVCTPYHSFNIDAKFNGALVVIGLLYGKGNLKNTMDIVVRCGQDTDCNTANAAALLGIIYGYDAIPVEFKSYLPKIADKVFLHTNYSYNKAVSQTMRFIDETVVRNGGQVLKDKYRIRVQKPRSPKLAESFGNLRMKYQVQVCDSSKWNFDSDWQDFVYGDGDNDKYKVAMKPGATFEVSFDGTGVALLGSWNVDCGKTNVYIYDKLVQVIDTYYKEEAGKYDVNRAYLFYKLNIPDGRHALKVVSSNDKNEKSKGNKLYVERIIVYDKSGKANNQK